MKGKSKKFFRVKFRDPGQIMAYVICNNCPYRCMYEFSHSFAEIEDQQMLDAFLPPHPCHLPNVIPKFEFISHSNWKRLTKSRGTMINYHVEGHYK